MIDALIEREGGFVDHPDDAGGPTHYGITIATLREWRTEQVTAEDVRNLTRREAREIYRQLYIVNPNLEMIVDSRLREQVFDCGVMHGPGTAVRWLQASAAGHVAVDGVLGPLTAAQVNSSDVRTLGNKLAVHRCRTLAAIVSSDETQGAFIEGWVRRATSFIF